MASSGKVYSRLAIFSGLALLWSIMSLMRSHQAPAQ